MTASKFAVVLACALAAGACTSIVEIRTDHSAVSVTARGDKGLGEGECVTGRPAPSEMVNSLEDYGNFLIGYVEFDDQGWLYPRGEKGQPDQIYALLQRMRDELTNHPEANLVTLVFIHGWHHNAHDNDCNVKEFRGMVERTQQMFARQRPGEKESRVVGVYVGWRGEAVDVPVLRNSTILDRRYTAEHVAKGSVRELFGELRQLELEQPGTDDPRVRTIIVGHSFGGLIVFNALSQALVNELVATKPRLQPGSTGDSKCEASKATGPRPWPDQMVLINPAFEASRFESPYHASQLEKGCHYPAERPRLLSVTADNDWATGAVYTTFRWFGTLFEGYNDMSSKAEDDVEKDANLHTVGRVKRYQTHRLNLKKESGHPYVESTFAPSAGTGVEADPNTPLWVLRAPLEIVDGHDGFLYSRHEDTLVPKPYLLNWLLCVHLSKGAAAQTTQCQIEEAAR